MSFANWNLLDEALTLIPPTKVQYRKWLVNKTDKFGRIAAGYSDWMDAFGIVQPNGESNEHVEGFDFSKSRVTIWLRGVELTGTGTVNDRSPDQIRYVGKVYNVMTVDNWLPYDNYRRCDCVEASNLGTGQAESGSVPVLTNESSANTESSDDSTDDVTTPIPSSGYAGGVITPTHITF